MDRCGAHGRASAWRLRGAGLGSWRLDGPHTVSARKEEAEALREALSSGAWRWHRDGERGDRTNQRRAFGRVSSASGADGDGMPRRTAADATAHDGIWIGGH
jgi:hypothetical protein